MDTVNEYQPVLIVLLMCLLSGCAVVARECPDTAKMYREQRGQVVIWCQK